MKLPFDELRDFLEEKHNLYDRTDFIDSDPISIPHQFDVKEDIEIAGFFSAIIAWGVRKTIINNANRLIQMMDLSPYEFVMNHSDKELKQFEQFVHRTFNGIDCIYFIQSLRNIYQHHGGLESVFSGKDAKESIMNFRRVFFELPFPQRTSKHIANPEKNSAAKRINMFLRWMVRKDGRGVDFGIWKNIEPANLVCPLDVHSGKVARKLGLISTPSDDWKAAMELTDKLREFDPKDPVKYDFALFGLGIFEKF